MYWTELISKQLDDGNYGCGIFVDIQKGFHTVEHDIFLNKVEQWC